MAIGPQFIPDIPEPHGEIRARLWLLLPLRLYAGWHFVAAAVRHVAAGVFSAPEQLPDSFRMGLMAPEYPYGFYRAFITQVVDPHAGFFAFIVVFAELFVGLMLAFGALTRLACYLGLFLLANVMLARNSAVFAEVHAPTAMFLIVLTLAFTGAGRAFGVDHALHKRLPGWIA